MKVALVYDDLYQHGGGEGLFLHLTKVFPKAVIYVPIVSKPHLQNLHGRHVCKSTFLSLVASFGRAGYRLSSLLSLVWFESLFLGKYDLVISLSNRFAHCVITPAETKHVSIITCPFRELWEDPKNTKNNFISPFSIFKSVLRTYNFYTAQRPDLVVAISSFVSKKISKSWRLRKHPIPILPPPVITKVSSRPNKAPFKELESYLLLVSRLNKWKYPYIKEVLLQLKNSKINVIHVGKGPLLEKAKKDFCMYKNIKFLGRVNEKILCVLYSKALALVHPQVEDFGLTPLEGMYFNLPIVAFKKGGILDYLNPKVALFYTDKKHFISATTKVLEYPINNEEIEKILKLHSFSNFRYNLLQLIKFTK